MRAAALVLSAFACVALACGSRSLNGRDGAADVADARPPADARPDDAWRAETPPEAPSADAAPPDAPSSEVPPADGGDGGEVACALEAAIDAAPSVGVGPCVGAGLLDPELQGTTAWRATGGARFSCGTAILDGDSMCALGGITQMLPVQDLACDLPLVLNIKGTGRCDNGCWLDLAVGQVWNRVFFGFSWDQPLCLGAAGQRGGVGLFLGGAARDCPKADESYPGTITLERVSITVDTQGICPPLGAVANGDFEAPAMGWTIDWGQNGLVSIEPGIGQGASKAARVTGARVPSFFCSGPQISAAASIPTAAMLSNPAFQVWSHASALADATVSIAGTVLSLPDSVEPKTTNVCVPHWAQGTVQTVTLGLNRNGFGPGCEMDRQAIFDDARFVTDPSCTANANLFNPGFEEATPTAGAYRAWQGGQVRRDSSLAHSGDAAMVMGPTDVGGTVSQSVTLPATAGSAGPALSFWIKAMDVLRHRPSGTSGSTPASRTG